MQEPNGPYRLGPLDKGTSTSPRGVEVRDEEGPAGAELIHLAQCVMVVADGPGALSPPRCRAELAQAVALGRRLLLVVTQEAGGLKGITGRTHPPHRESSHLIIRLLIQFLLPPHSLFTSPSCLVPRFRPSVLQQHCIVFRPGAA